MPGDPSGAHVTLSDGGNGSRGSIGAGKVRCVSFVEKNMLKLSVNLGSSVGRSSMYHWTGVGTESVETEHWKMVGKPSTVLPAGGSVCGRIHVTFS